MYGFRVALESSNDTDLSYRISKTRGQNFSGDQPNIILLRIRAEDRRRDEGEDLATDLLSVNARADPPSDQQDFRIDQLSGVWEPSGLFSSIRPSDQHRKLRS